MAMGNPNPNPGTAVRNVAMLQGDSQDTRDTRLNRLRHGRDTLYRAPPAQIRACGITAHGSYLG